MDIGASTGGFTDCLLQHGAARVIAVDTGYGQMDARLRDDPRVRLLEKTNARYLTPEQLWAGGEREAIACWPWTSRSSLLHSFSRRLLRCVRSSSATFETVVLVKPQFEVGRQQVGKGGIVRDPQAQQAAVDKVTAAVVELGGSEVEVIESPDSRRGREPRVSSPCPIRLGRSAADGRSRYTGHFSIE